MYKELLFEKGRSVMKSRTKVWLIIATSLVLIGGILFAGIMTNLDWDFNKLSTDKFVTNTYLINEVFDDIRIESDTADILFVLSDGDECRVECYEEAKHTITIKDNTLVIESTPKEHWYDNVGISFDTPKITVYLPKAEYAALFIKGSTGDVEITKDFDFNDVDISLSTGDVTFNASASEMIKIKTSTGDIWLENISTRALDLSVSTGEITVSGVNCEGDVKVVVSTGKSKITDTRCKSLISSGDTGDISLDNVIATQKLLIERSTGDVKFNRCDAAEVYVKTDTGDVSGTMLSDKVFITETDTGRVNVPNSITGGRCEITTDTGDIKIAVNN